MARRIYKRQTSSKKSIFIPIGIGLALFLLAGFLIISYFDEFYHAEKTQEATILAQSYANTLESTLDARVLLTEQLHTTLQVAGNIVSKQEEPFSNQMLADLAMHLNVDVVYLYDKDGRIEYSSDNLYPAWIAPQGHPVRDFLESGLDHSVEAIRADSEAPEMFWMYSYQRYGDGKLVQSGIRADKLAQLYAHLDEQWLIDQIAQNSPFTQVAYINPDNIITASSIPAEIGQSIDADTLAEGPTHLAFDEGRLDWHLKLYIPIQIDGVQSGMLAFLFDLSNTNRLFVRIALTTTFLLLVIFILFSISVINIANKNKRIFTVAYYDETTKLPNIRYLKRVLQEEEHKKLALIIINPLHFKHINLIYGYTYGDELLLLIAQSLGRIATKAAELEVYRFSDDQFIIMVKNYESQEVLHTLCRQILSNNEESGALGSVDFTIGVVEWDKKGLDFDLIIKRASIALSAATKRNRIRFYTEEIEEQILRQDTIETELKRVIAGEKRILHLVYQPIVDAKSGSIISFEALARMHSTILGSVPPLEFIAIAEARHLIITLGKVILQEAAAFVKKLTERGYTSYPIAINVSAMQLLDETFVVAIQDIATEAGIRTEQLEMELTESVFSSNFEFLSKQMEKIHALGIRIAIDDFGTGFSSLNRLQGLVVDTLKLDKQFVDKLMDPKASGISSDIISMAHHLGKLIIAEGVETKEQQHTLLGMGCNFMQGYLFSRPVGEEEAIALLSRQRGDS